MASDLQVGNELLEDMATGSHPHGTRTLERAALSPLVDAVLAEELPAVVALKGLVRNLKTNAADQLILELLVHLTIVDPRQVMSALIEVLGHSLRSKRIRDLLRSDGSTSHGHTVAFAVSSRISFRLVSDPQSASCYESVVRVGSLRSLAHDSLALMSCWIDRSKDLSQV